MLKNIYKWLFLSIFLLTGLPNLSYAKENLKFEKIVFFGDSLSDSGNLYSDTFGYIPKSPPYFKGRFTNGLVWSEHIEQYYYDKAYVSATNYAVGGQTAIMHNPMGGFLPYTLTMAVDKYLLGSIFRDRSKTLFIIWIGANDYLPGIKDVDDLTTKVTNAIASTVDSLIYYGAINILVLNLPDLSVTPFGQQAETKATLHAASILHNLKLKEALQKVAEKNSTANIHLYTVDRQIAEFIKNPDIHNRAHHTHITNLTDSCWKGAYNGRNAAYINQYRIADQFLNHLNNNKRSDTQKTPLDPKLLASYITNNPALMETVAVSAKEESGQIPCLLPDNYLFWDRVHPSAVAHRMISEDIIEFINRRYT